MLSAIVPELCFCRALGCMPLIALAYFLLWFLPPFTSLRGLWYTAFYCLFQALATVSVLLSPTASFDYSSE